MANSKTIINDQTVKVNQTLQQAYLAAENHNWLQVNYYLQQLPLRFKQTNQPCNLPEELWQQTWQLALDVLWYGDFQQRWEIGKIVPLLGNEIIQPLIDVLENEAAELELRWFICRLLGEFERPEVVIALVKLLQHSEEDLALMAADSLAKIGKSAIENLAELLTDEESRLLAVTALAHIRHPQTIKPLLNVVKDPQVTIRAIAIEALGSFHDEHIPHVLIEALQDPAAIVRKEAVTALGFRSNLYQELNLVEKIQPLLYDLNLEVCRQAAIALARIKNQQAVTALNQVLISSATPENLKIDLLKALTWTETELALDYLQQALLTENQSISSEIIIWLGRIIKPNLKRKAVEILANFWQEIKFQNPSLRLKQNLAISLGELREDRALEVLKQLAIDEEKKVSLHAIAGIKKIQLNRICSESFKC